MELHEIRYFLALSETLNFTRAAEQCHVSQPALTRAVKSLEDKLGGGPLVNRERNNIHLTDLGRLMKPYFEHVVEGLEAAHSKAKAYARLDDIVLRIGLMCTIGPKRMIDLFARFREDYPNITIHLEDAPVDRIEERLFTGDIDIALFARPEELDGRLHAVPLFRERFLVALPPHDALAEKDAVSMRELNGYSYLGRATCEFYSHLRDTRMRLGGIEFERPYVSDRDDWIQCMVRAGLGFTYLPEYALTDPGLVTRPLIEPEVWRTVNVVTMRGRPHSPAVGAFMHAARQYAWAGKVAPSQAGGNMGNGESDKAAD